MHAGRQNQLPKPSTKGGTGAVATRGQPGAAVERAVTRGTTGLGARRLPRPPGVVTWIAGGTPLVVPGAGRSAGVGWPGPGLVVAGAAANC